MIVIIYSNIRVNYGANTDLIVGQMFYPVTYVYYHYYIQYSSI